LNYSKQLKNGKLCFWFVLLFILLVDLFVLVY
jgi:hypothetical protein